MALQPGPQRETPSQKKRKRKRKADIKIQLFSIKLNIKEICKNAKQCYCFLTIIELKKKSVTERRLGEPQVFGN